MRFQAPHRSPVACLAFAALLTLGGCGNRGELYLESPADAEAELRALESVESVDDPLPGTGPDGAPATDPSPLVPGEGVAPTPAPAFDPDADEDEDEDDGS